MFKGLIGERRSGHADIKLPFFKSCVRLVLYLASGFNFYQSYISIL